MIKASSDQPNTANTMPTGHRIKTPPAPDDSTRFTFEVWTVKGDRLLLTGGTTYARAFDARQAAKQAFRKNRGWILEQDPAVPQELNRRSRYKFRTPGDVKVDKRNIGGKKGREAEALLAADLLAWVPPTADT